MPEIQEQIHDYRCPVPTLLLPPCPLAPFLSPDVCVHLTSCPVLGVGIHLFLSLCVWLRTKRTLGLGSLYGENDLLELDGDPLRERQVAEKQLAALGDIL